MNITNQCKEAVLEHGILMNGEEPAGKSLMALPTMKIAVIQNEFPPELMTDELKAFIEQGGWDIGNPDSFPSGIENSIRKAVGFWYQGNIDFVPIDQNPDLKIFAFDGHSHIGGFASFPINDSDELDRLGRRAHAGLDEPVIGIDMGAQRFAQKYTVTQKFSLLEKIQDTITHEFGHNIGILHTNKTSMKVQEHSSESCAQKDITALIDQFQKSHMINISSGISESSDVDSLYRGTIKGSQPKF
ncbi:MAG: hypothetical protein ACRBDL_08970 [Alphaproteobacteria bacterium]